MAKRVLKGVREGGQFAVDAKAEPDVALAGEEQHDAALEAALEASVLRAESFNRPEGPKSFAVDAGGTWTTYGFTLHPDGTEDTRCIGDATSAEQVAGSLALGIPKPYEEAKAEAREAAELLYAEVERIRALPLSGSEKIARRNLRVRTAFTAAERATRYDSRGTDLRRMASTDPDGFLEMWDRYAGQGRCDLHTDHAAAHKVAAGCVECQVALAAQHNRGKSPSYTPEPLPDAPVHNHPAKGAVREVDVDDDENDVVTTRYTTHEADPALAAALREHFRAGPDAKVEITEEAWEDHSSYTVESGSEIRVNIGDSQFIYQDLGALMRDLDRSARGNLQEKAKRFCGTADTGNQQGPVGIYLPGRSSKPVIGWITVTYTLGGFNFVHQDGRNELFKSREYRDIVPTDQTRPAPHLDRAEAREVQP